MRPAVGCALLALGLGLSLAALAAAQPLHLAEATTEWPAGDAPAAADTAPDAPAVVDAVAPSTKGPPSSPANNSERVPAPLMDAMTQLVLDVSRLAMELHRRGGAKTVTAQRVDMPDASAVLLTFYPSAAAAAAASLAPEALPAELPAAAAAAAAAQGNQEQEEEVGNRVMDYETSAEATFSKPLPLRVKRLPTPVVPDELPLAQPAAHAKNSGFGVVVAEEASAEKTPRKVQARGAAKAGVGSRQSGRADGVAHRFGGDDMWWGLMPAGGQGDRYGLDWVMRGLDTIRRVVAVLRAVLGRGGAFAGDGEIVAGGRSLDAPESRIVQEVAVRVANMLDSREHAKETHAVKKRAGVGVRRGRGP